MPNALREAAWIMRQFSSRGVQGVIPLKAMLLYRLKREHIRLRLQGIPSHVKDNIRSTFAHLDDDQVNIIARNFLEFMGRVELRNALSSRVSLKQKWWTVDGLQHLDSALSLGRGALLVSGHVGHARLIGPILGTCGYKPRLVRTMGFEVSRRSQRLEQLAASSPLARQVIRNLIMDPVELQDIRVDIDIRPILSSLANNQPIIILGDGLRSTEFVTLQLLGRPYPFPVGLIKIAKMTGTPVLPTFAMESSGNFQLRVEIQPDLALESKSLIAGIQSMSESIDEQLRQAPHQWHRWNIVNVFDNAMVWSQSSDRWNQRFIKWCSERPIALRRGDKDGLQ